MRDPRSRIVPGKMSSKIWISLILGLFVLGICVFLPGRRYQLGQADPFYKEVVANSSCAEPAGINVSPDGKYLLTRDAQSKQFRICVLEKTSGEQKGADTSESAQVALTWRPDNQAIAFQEISGKSRPLYLLDL